MRVIDQYESRENDSQNNVLQNSRQLATLARQVATFASVSEQQRRNSNSGAAQRLTGKARGKFLPVLIRFLLVSGLGLLSWFATYSGMMEIIEASGGRISFEHKLGIGFSVAMLMLMIIYLLDALFSPLRWWLRLSYLAGYIFLTLISVGFGFGFYWKYLSSHSEATRAAESAVSQVQGSLQVGLMRLEQLRMTLDHLTSMSSQKAEQERTVGQTCPKSPPGDGPRRLLRDTDAKNFRFASEFVTHRSQLLKKEIADLNNQFARINSKVSGVIDPVTGTRSAFMHTLNGQLGMTITRFNVFRSDPQLMQYRESFATRSSQTMFDDSSGGTISCPDPQLHMALMGVVKAIDGLPELQSPRLSNVEGSDAILEAFRRLTVSLTGYLTLDPAPSPEAVREAQKNAASLSGRKQDASLLTRQPGLGERDYLPLFIAVFVDLCLLLVSVNRPVNRLHMFWGKVQNAENAGLHDILRRFHEVHFSGQSERLDVFHDVMFDLGPEHYVAVPLDLRLRPKGKNLTDQEMQAHQDKLMKSRYLSTLLVTLEEAGLASRAHRVGPFKARRKLKALGSPFSDAPGFRVYKFGKGAWPALVLDDVLGQSRCLQDRDLDQVNMNRLVEKLQSFTPETEDMAPALDNVEPLKLEHLPDAGQSHYPVKVEPVTQAVQEEGGNVLAAEEAVPRTFQGQSDDGAEGGAHSDKPGGKPAEVACLQNVIVNSWQEAGVVIRPDIQEWNIHLPVSREVMAGRSEAGDIKADRQEDIQPQPVQQGMMQQDMIKQDVAEFGTGESFQNHKLASENEKICESHHVIRPDEVPEEDIPGKIKKSSAVQINGHETYDEEFIKKIHNEIRDIDSYSDLFKDDMEKDQEIFENIYQEKIVNSSFSEGVETGIDIDIEKIAWHFAHKNAANSNNR